ncbi:TolC family protein [Terriglobus saanensis]|uniref:Outer membrane efflux protein n=1 Tax=Terriglobus saanensis (strain ATCC BAA-1853 / DSM 23119 / SP1PR4) TaxID=401053 RepID=E8V1W2_TERSS|nr:TolC family protein [Terriglobus saanensis]ADV83450.1 outer membrane efflux protein [Terriglobus saanensis SP1PR4]
MASMVAADRAYSQDTLSNVALQATRNSERVKVAESDLVKAKAALSGARDVYIPSVSVSSGLGASSGITLSVPTVFTASAQSLVFNYSQRNYIRATRFGVEAADQSLAEVRQQVEEDAAVTYSSLAYALRSQAVLREQKKIGSRLIEIVSDRLAAGYETELEAMKVQKETAAIELQEIQMAHRIEFLKQHLAVLTGTAEGFITVEVQSVPLRTIGLTAMHLDVPCAAGADVLAALAEARANLQTSFGDARYTWRPQVVLQAQYGRISPFNDVSSYYNLHGNYNTLAVGVQLQLPMFDFGRHAHARETAADAAKAEHQVTLRRQQQTESCGQVRHSVTELAAQGKIAQLDYKIAAAELEAIDIRANNGDASAPTPITPKDRFRTLMQVGQKHLDSLAIDAQLMEAYIHYLKKTSGLDNWISSGAQL